MKPKKTHAASYSVGRMWWLLCCEGTAPYDMRPSKRPTCKRCQRIIKAARAKGRGKK